jgi:hypothetical protein
MLCVSVLAYRPTYPISASAFLALPCEIKRVILTRLDSGAKMGLPERAATR